MPGTRLPKWFTENSVTILKPKTHELKGVIIGIVLSINHDIPSELRDKLPGVVDIKVNVLRLGKSIYDSVLDLRGLPRTNEEHIHLCRYPAYSKLISMLEHGDTICVTLRDPPVDKGLEMKKCGLHLVFGEDDEYGGEEEYVDPSQQSVSEKLAKFFNTCDVDSSKEDGIESKGDNEFQKELETRD